MQGVDSQHPWYTHDISGCNPRHGLAHPKHERIPGTRQVKLRRDLLEIVETVIEAMATMRAKSVAKIAENHVKY